jgi:DNA-binding response OmpR family regulator
MNTNNLFEEKKLVNITKREKKFIAFLIENQKATTSTEDIKQKLWEDEEVSDERLRTFIKRLRAKTDKELIRNIAGQGYIINN